MLHKKRRWSTRSVMISRVFAGANTAAMSFCCCLLLAGCGGGLPMGQVTGKVTLDGNPVTSGVVHFVPKKGPAATGPLDENGQYRLTTPGKGLGAVMGTHTIYLTPTSDEAHMEGFSQADYESGKLAPEEPPQPFLPNRYLNLSSSGLQREVAAGSQEHDFQLTSQP